jgi:hypothetical protein
VAIESTKGKMGGVSFGDPGFIRKQAQQEALKLKRKQADDAAMAASYLIGRPLENKELGFVAQAMKTRPSRGPKPGSLEGILEQRRKVAEENLFPQASPFASHIDDLLGQSEEAVAGGSGPEKAYRPFGGRSIWQTNREKINAIKLPAIEAIK